MPSEDRGESSLGPRDLVRKYESLIDLLAHMVYRYPQATSGDVLALSRTITEAIERRLTEIAARRSKPEEP